MCHYIVSLYNQIGQFLPCSGGLGDLPKVASSVEGSKATALPSSVSVVNEPELLASTADGTANKEPGG
jgi:hypothetical protein